MAKPVIYLDNLSKTYLVPERDAGVMAAARGLVQRRNRAIKAVDRVSFAVEPGEMVGFLGPNGAGKTTTLKMVTCVSPVTSGQLLVAGMDVRTSSRAIKARLGVVSQADSLDPDLSVMQNLLAFARFFDR